MYTFLVWTWLGTINNLFEIKTINVIIKNMFYCSHNLSYWPSYPDVLKIKKVRNEFVDFFYKKYFHFILQQFLFQISYKTSGYNGQCKWFWLIFASSSTSSVLFFNRFLCWRGNFLSGDLTVTFFGFGAFHRCGDRKLRLTGGFL